tara:strand:+ start:3089 stop:3502 length:414 start_codon:yes stop_codon:yes gene_type:complete
MPYDDKKKKGGSASGAGMAGKATPNKAMTKTSSPVKKKVTNLPSVDAVGKKKPTGKVDFDKRAKTIDAAIGTPLGEKGTPKGDAQRAFAKQKIKEGNASSLNRDSRISKLADELRAQDSASKSTFKDKDHKKLSGKF